MQDNSAWARQWQAFCRCQMHASIGKINLLAPKTENEEAASHHEKPLPRFHPSVCSESPSSYFSSVNFAEI